MFFRYYDFSGIYYEICLNILGAFYLVTMQKKKENAHYLQVALESLYSPQTPRPPVGLDNVESWHDLQLVEGCIG